MQNFGIVITSCKIYLPIESKLAPMSSQDGINKNPREHVSNRDFNQFFNYRNFIVHR